MLQANQVCFSNLYLRNSKDSEYFFHNEVLICNYYDESMEIAY